MEQKLLKIFKLADKLNTKQSKVYAEINYSANDSQKLEIIITEDSEIKWDNVITLFETFVGGVSYE